MPVSLATSASCGSSGQGLPPESLPPFPGTPFLPLPAEHPCYEPTLCVEILSWTENGWVLGSFYENMCVHVRVQGNVKTGFQKLWYDLNIYIRQITAFNTEIAILYVMLQENTWGIYKVYSWTVPWKQAGWIMRHSFEL